AVTYMHHNFLNLINCSCGISCAGDFDSTKSMHFYMKQFELVVEFPSGSFLLIPSSLVDHETCYSLTQYAAAGLFAGQH
ncbi:hypothetical protein C8J57DRAFT_1034649, partial [Mycena rebaudengoi]